MRAVFFAWTATLGKILMTDNLRKQCIIVMDWCCTCKKSGESMDHLFVIRLRIVERGRGVYVICNIGERWCSIALFNVG